LNWYFRRDRLYILDIHRQPGRKNCNWIDILDDHLHARKTTCYIFNSKVKSTQPATPIKFQLVNSRVIFHMFGQSDMQYYRSVFVTYLPISIQMFSRRWFMFVVCCISRGKKIVSKNWNMNNIWMSDNISFSNRPWMAINHLYLYIFVSLSDYFAWSHRCYLFASSFFKSPFWSRRLNWKKKF
jgi:hypothetical protein